MKVYCLNAICAMNMDILPETRKLQAVKKAGRFAKGLIVKQSELVQDQTP